MQLVYFIQVDGLLGELTAGVVGPDEEVLVAGRKEEVDVVDWRLEVSSDQEAGTMARSQVVLGAW